MIVRQFISWIRTAPAGERAEATRALARAWLISDLTEDDRAAAEGALLMLLDDPSPLVRQAMADVFARSTEAPAAIVQALSLDQPSVALPILGSTGAASLHDFRGKVVVLNVFASWCDPCKAEAPILEQEQRKLAGHGASQPDVITAPTSRPTA